MSILITLTPEEERKLAELARARGTVPATHVHDVVAAYLNGADEKGTKSFQEILAPIWEGWQQSGIADRELDELFTKELQDSRSERAPVERVNVSQGGPPRAVFDCMVFLQASSRPNGPAARLLIDYVQSGRLALYVSDTIIAEFRDVVGRPRIRAKNPAITDETVEEFCNRVQQVAERIDPVPAEFILARDPDDEPYLNLAIAAAVDYLVTWDNDMLDLMQGPAFRASIRVSRSSIP